MDVAKRAVGSLIGLGAAVLLGYIRNLWLIGFGVAVLAVIYACLHLYERGHPSPPPAWAVALEKENKDQSAMLARLLPTRSGAAIGTAGMSGRASGVQGTAPIETGVGVAVETEFAVSISAVKQWGNWQIIHQWGPDIGPSPEPGVIVAVRSINGEKQRIPRCEVLGPDGNTLSYDFTGAEFYEDPRQALARLEPADFAAAFYPKTFTTEPTQLADGRYEVRWFMAMDEGAIQEWITAAFTMEGGKLIP